MTRPVLVSDAKRRFCISEGEPRWEFKLSGARRDDRRCAGFDAAHQRKQDLPAGYHDRASLADGFPSGRDLFDYAGIIVGSVDADYFTPCSRSYCASMSSPGRRHTVPWWPLVAERWSLGSSSMNELLPIFFHRGEQLPSQPATVELTRLAWIADYSTARDQRRRRAMEERLLADYEDLLSQAAPTVLGI